MIKRGVLIVFGLMFTLSMLVNVSAASYGANDIGYLLREGIDSARVMIEPVFELIIGDYAGYDFFWTKVFLFVLLFVIVRYILGKIDTFKDNSTVVFIVAFVVSLFSVRYMNDNDLLRGVLLPYGVMGVAILTILPFMIFFWFVHKSNMHAGGRKLSWIFFAVVFGVLWWNRFDDLSPIGNQIYGWTLLAIVAVIFMDKTIHEYFGIQEDKEWRRKLVSDQIVRVQSNIQDVESKNPGTTDRTILKWLDDEKKKLLHLRKKLNRL